VGSALQGITTSGSALYPKAISEIFGAVPRQICKFHVLAAVTRAVLHEVARGRIQLDARKPKPLGRRPCRARTKQCNWRNGWKHRRLACSSSACGLSAVLDGSFLFRLTAEENHAVTKVALLQEFEPQSDIIGEGLFSTC
jgi:hypothetical protein